MIRQLIYYILPRGSGSRRIVGWGGARDLMTGRVNSRRARVRVTRDETNVAMHVAVPA